MHPNGNAHDWMTAVEEWKKSYDGIKAEWELAKRSAGDTVGTPGVSTGAPASNAAAGAAAGGEDVDPAVADLQLKATLRRAESCNFQICDGTEDGAKTIIKDSILWSMAGEVGKKHVAIIGDFACLPDQSSRPWYRPPICHGQLCRRPTGCWARHLRDNRQGSFHHAPFRCNARG